LKVNLSAPEVTPTPNAGLHTEGLAAAIHHRPHFVELIVDRVEVAQRSHVRIFFGGDGPRFVEIVRNSRRRNKFQIPKTAVIIGIYDRLKMMSTGWRCNPTIGRTSDVNVRDSQ